jgi:hypothetical protein
LLLVAVTRIQWQKTHGILDFGEQYERRAHLSRHRRIPVDFRYGFLEAAQAITMKTSILIFAFAGGTLSQDIHERASNWTVGQTVQTTSGPVKGHAAYNVTTEVSEYLGIPYAIPPVGDLRWKAPQRYNGSLTISGSLFVRIPHLSCMR